VKYNKQISKGSKLRATTNTSVHLGFKFRVIPLFISNTSVATVLSLVQEIKNEKELLPFRKNILIKIIPGKKVVNLKLPLRHYSSVAK